MGAAWARAFRDLRPDAQRLVRALAVLDSSSISLVGAAAVVEMPVARAAAILAAVAEAGWGAVAEDRLTVVDGARAYLADLASSVSVAEVDSVLVRVADAMIEETTDTTTRMTPGVQGDVVSVIHAAGRRRRADLVGAVARAAWRAPDVREHLGWCRELAQHGEDAAIASQQPELLVELLDLSAATYTAAADWSSAERAWLRALAIVEDLGGTTRLEHFLQLLATNYLNWERPHKAVDMLVDIVAIHEREGDLVKTAEALAAVARTMADADRSDAAIEYLGRADDALRAHQDENPAVARLHATVLGDLGRLHARLGGINTARTYYHQALALVVDTDDEVAERIRVLQAALSRFPSSGAG